MILGIETSTTHASLALVQSIDGPAVRECNFVSERAHNAVIFEPVTELLAEHRDELRGIAVGLGPGSYGGVRVGIAVANGLSLVLGIPVAGVSSLEAWDAQSPDYTVLGDARRKTFFRAEVRDRELRGEPELLPEEEAIAQVSAIVSCGESSFYSADTKVCAAIPGVTHSFPTATRIARAALRNDPSTWPTDALLEPHYLRAPYITQPKSKT